MRPGLLGHKVPVLENFSEPVTNPRNAELSCPYIKVVEGLLEATFYPVTCFNCICVFLQW